MNIEAPLVIKGGTAQVFVRLVGPFLSAIMCRDVFVRLSDRIMKFNGDSKRSD